MYGARALSEYEEELYRGQSGISFSAETFADWTDEIAYMRVACTVLDLLQESDSKQMRKYLRWEKTPFDDDPHLPQKAWFFDTQPDHPLLASIVGRVKNYIYTGLTPSEFDDPLTIGWEWLTSTINKKIGGLVHPILVMTKTKKPVERLVSDSLLAVMWSQLFQAILGEKKYRR